MLLSAFKISCRCRERLSFLDITSVGGSISVSNTRNPSLVKLSSVWYSKTYNPNDETSSSDETSSDDELPSTSKAQVSKNSSTKNKLSSLLTSMVKATPTSQLKPAEKDRKFSWLRDDKRKEKSKKPLPLDPEMTKAAKEVAESLGGDVKKTESELLNKLLSRNGDSLECGKLPEAEKKNINLSDLIVGMRIDRTPVQQVTEKRMQRSQRILSQSRATRQEQQYDPEIKNRLQLKRSKMVQDSKISGKVDLFGAVPLGIFQQSRLHEEKVKLRTWEHLVQRELRLAVTHPPANAFEEMILWTEKGLLWKFPIDNEQGLEEESKVHFTEHVFLERHLSPWCPTKGPIRHFMELVCVGLSKNPYIKVQDKVNHINWYRDYFNQKRDVLQTDGITLPPLDQEEHKRLE